MSHYKVLARKYRPDSFQDLIGQDCLVTTLSNAINKQQIPHAILLTGVRGIGKTTTARIIARSLNCVGEKGDGAETISPCGKCQHCTAIKNDNHLDVIEMDAASRTGVDDIRQIIETSYYRPASARYKIHIIDEVHMLTKQAFNALLKTLEQPPEYTKFIFATTEVNRIPDTIISRCIRFDLRKFSIIDSCALISQVCKKEGISIEDSAIKALAKSANGSARDGLSLLEQAKNISTSTITASEVLNMLGNAKQGEVIDIFAAIVLGDVKLALSLYENIASNGLDINNFIQDLLDIIHEATRLQMSSDFVDKSLLAEDQVQKLLAMAQKLTMPILTRIWQVTVRGKEEIQKTSYSSKALEMIIIRLCYLSNLPTTDEIIKDVIKKNSVIEESVTDQQETVIVKDNTATNKVNKEIINQHDVSHNTNNPVSSLDDLLRLFDSHKEPLLKYQIENNTCVVAFDSCKHNVVLAVKKELMPNFIKTVQEKLLLWTGNKWLLHFDESANDDSAKTKTIREQQIEDKQQLLNEVKKTDLVKTALEIFPESGINDAKLISNE